VFANKELRRIFGPKRGEVTRGWRQLHKDEFLNVYCTPNIIRVIKSGKIKFVGLTACMGKLRNMLKILVGKPEGRNLLERPRHRWENIKLEL
jgi:hypothetical protein